MKTVQFSKNESSYRSISRTKTILIFIFTIIFGFFLFAAPNLFFGITKINGGLVGINLLWMALFQLVAVCTLIYFSLKLLNKDFRQIGITTKYWKKDSLLGFAVGIAWTLLQFTLIIPSTGGAEREDIRQMITMMDGTLMGLVAYMTLGVIGGGITEEIYNRGYFISILQDVFKNPKTGLYVAAILSVIFFAAGHLPTNITAWFDILIPTLLYTLLFLSTKRLTASIIAHGMYNFLAILFTYILYFK